ncbi:MAG: zinc ribbon domain-containing protein [Verrucomicrobia bacterium]|nr:zinc ribbon domain-containing protein [Verrucomicrobiota bacterium]
MPTYEYVCSKCDETFDLFQSISDHPITTCPKDLCRQKTWGKGKVKRAITAGAGLIFKGSGFYITDYRSDKYKEAAKKESPAPASSTESKPAPAKGESTAAKSTSTKSDA